MTIHQNLTKIVFISALGYFVDVFDLFLFSVTRIQSLKDLGIPADQLMTIGSSILNYQMAGLLLGGFIWGLAGDYFGRVRVLYLSIFLYSLFTFLNGFVQSVEQYQWCRFFAGFGLAGELGAAITLVAEVSSAKKRGIATTWIGALGFLGGITAGATAKFLSWRYCFEIGGLLGFILLAFRLQVKESYLFLEYKQKARQQKFFTALKILFANKYLSKMYFSFVLIGCPIWFVAGILIAFAPEFAQSIGVVGKVIPADSVLISYIGVILGDVSCGLLSQKLRSRKKALLVFLGITLLGIPIYFSCSGFDDSVFLFVCFLVGIGTGYWAVLLTFAAESFPTAVRATVSTSVPNLIRASVVIMLVALEKLKFFYDLKQAAIIIAIFVFILAFGALWQTKETFGQELHD